MEETLPDKEAQLEAELGRGVSSSNLTNGYDSNPNMWVPAGVSSSKTQLGGAVVTAKGGRWTQEDRGNAYLCHNNFSKPFLEECDLEKKKEVLRQKIAEIAKKARRWPYRSGSTLTASLIWTRIDPATSKKIACVLTAQIGDSRAFIVDHSQSKAFTLTQQHNLSGKELKRITDDKNYKAMGGYLDHTHLWVKNSKTGLNVSRSLGDHEFKPLVSDEPEFSYKEVDAENAHLISCSDGLEDVSVSKFAGILRSEGSELTQAGEYAISYATYVDSRKGGYSLQNAYDFDYKTRIGDNKIVVITPLNKIADGQVVFQFVADGHGGKGVANLIARTCKRFVRQRPSYTPPLSFDEATKNLVDAVISPNQNKSSEKYDVTKELGQLIKNKLQGEVTEEVKAEIKEMLQHFLLLALQRVKGGATNTTSSGLKIFSLLNKHQTEYHGLIKELFPHLALDHVQYRDIREFALGSAFNSETARQKQKASEQVFNNKHKEELFAFERKMITFWKKSSNSAPQAKPELKNYIAQVAPKNIKASG